MAAHGRHCLPESSTISSDEVVRLTPYDTTPYSSTYDLHLRLTSGSQRRPLPQELTRPQKGDIRGESALCVMDLRVAPHTLELVTMAYRVVFNAIFEILLLIITYIIGIYD